MKQLETLKSFQIFKSKINKSKTCSGWCLFKAYPLVPPSWRSNLAGRYLETTCKIFPSIFSWMVFNRPLTRNLKMFFFLLQNRSAIPRVPTQTGNESTCVLPDMLLRRLFIASSQNCYFGNPDWYMKWIYKWLSMVDQWNPAYHLDLRTPSPFSVPFIECRLRK